MPLSRTPRTTRARRFSESAIATFALERIGSGGKDGNHVDWRLSGCMANRLRILSRPFSLGTRAWYVAPGSSSIEVTHLGRASHLRLILSNRTKHVRGFVHANTPVTGQGVKIPRR